MDAVRDQNQIPVLLATLDSDGITPIKVLVDVTGHILQVDGASGTDNGRDVAVRDSNRIPVLMAVSSADGITPIEVYADSSGNLLTSSS